MSLHSSTPTSFSRLAARFVNLFAPKAKSGSTQLKDPEQRRPSQRLQRYSRYRIEMDQDNLRNAVLTAEQEFQPNRQILINLYDQAITTDTHLAAVARQRIAITNGEPFFVCGADREPDEDATNLLMRPWFRSFTKYYLEHVLYGHSLIEFCELEDGEFTEVQLIPREFVIPNSRTLIFNLSDRQGVNYTEAPWNEWLLEAGESKNLGLLLAATKQAIFKRYAEADWARRSERYGSPTLVVRTNEVRDAELAKKEQMASNMGSGGYVILDGDDEVTLMEANSSGDASKIYSERIRICNEEMSKLILGQTMTTENGSSQSQANVHERTMYELVEADMRSFQDYVNFSLFPFLIKHGYPLEGYQFVFKRFYSLFKDPFGQEPKPEQQGANQGVQDQEREQLSAKLPHGFF